MAWRDYLVNEMIPGMVKELDGLNKSIVSINANITHWQHWRDVYLGIQGVAKTNLEAELNVKKAPFVAGTHQAVWQGTHSYLTGRWVRPTVPNGFVYEAWTDGDSAGVEPIWPTNPGDYIMDNTVNWRTYIAQILIVYGVTYNVSDISSWIISDTPGWDSADSGTVHLYQYLGVGWDSDATIIKEINDWGICYVLLTDAVFGAYTFLTNLTTALTTIMTPWRDDIQNRNGFLGSYV